jgi:hypothetical protein
MQSGACRSAVRLTLGLLCLGPAAVAIPIALPACTSEVQTAREPEDSGPLSRTTVLTQCTEWKIDPPPTPCDSVTVFGPRSVLYRCLEGVIADGILCQGSGIVTSRDDAGVMYEFLCCDLGD